MELIIFSDVHGNIYALEKAIKLMDKYKINNYLFLGDMAGYYYHQNECVKLLHELPHLISIKGNHDNYFVEAMNNKERIKILDKKYGYSYSLLKERIDKSTKDYFFSLQDYEKNQVYEAYHGSPNNYLTEYIYPDNNNLSFPTLKSKFLFLGHTHYNMDKKYYDTRIINPGSIGQPRDYNKPSFCIVDLKNDLVEMVRFDYDKSRLNNDINKYDKNNEYLHNILKRENL